MAAPASKLDKLIKQANAALERENLGTALTLYEKAHKLDKNNPRIMLRLGQVLLAAGQHKRAAEILTKAAKKRATHADTHVLLSQAHLALGDMDSMHRSLDKALASEPGHGAAILGKVDAFLDSGLTDEAAAVLETVHEGARSGSLARLATAKVARQRKEHGAAIDALGAILDDPDALERHKRSARFELGHVHDSMGEYDEAFAFFKAANDAHNPGRVIHPESIKSTWSREALDSVPESTIHDDRPVIVAGVPRSGTTLTERIIHAHPKGAGVGECPILLQLSTRTLVANLDQSRIDDSAREYLAHLDETVGSASERIVDKHMGTEKTLGFVSRAIPDARVIHALRDPRDCCLSAYFQNFGTNVPYSRDLTTLGKHYRAHREMMDHWREVTELPFFVNVYEEFVADPEPATRAMLDFLGIEFDESCLRFHESREHVRTASSTQVRKPVYQSSRQRWRNYEAHIGPLLEALGDFADGVHATSTRGAEP